MVVNCKNGLDQGKEYSALLTDLSKAFDCFPHDLIVAKSHAYGFSTEWSKLINSYLTERKQGVKINDQLGSLMDILFGVLQGPLLFSIFLCDMFLFCKDVDFASYGQVFITTAQVAPWCSGYHYCTTSFYKA